MIRPDTRHPRCFGWSEMAAKRPPKDPRRLPELYWRLEGFDAFSDYWRQHALGEVAQASVQIDSDFPQALQSRKYVFLSLRTRTPLSRPFLAPQAEHNAGIAVFLSHAPHFQ